MPKGTPKSKTNKSEWIRQQPASLTAKELVAKAKKEGIEITDAQVYTTRSAAKKAKSESAPAKGKPGRKPSTAAVATSEKINKSAWIRQQPATLSAKEVVEKAQTAGIEISLAQVYTARSTAGAPKSKPGRKPAAAARVAAPAARSNNNELRAELARLAVILGTDESRLVIDRVDQALAV